MELPATKVPRTYRARAYGVVSQEQLEALVEGVEIDGVRYGSIDANLERSSGRNLWIEMTITEGKNREVRRVLEYLGLQVNRLIRTGYGPYNIGDLPRGQAVELTGKPTAQFIAEMTGQPIPRGGVKKAEKVAIAAPAKPPRRAPPSATPPAAPPKGDRRAPRPAGQAPRGGGPKGPASGKPARGRPASPRPPRGAR
jgi:hypothetical protein